MTINNLLQSATSGPWQTAGLGVQYRIERDGYESRLYFQSTASDSDWLFNLAFPPRPYRDQPIPWRAHWGFATLYKSARDEIIPQVLHAERVTVAGFSQGAALTVLAHEDIVFHRGPTGIQSYAFAPPRVLWLPSPAIRERFEGLTVIRRRGDVVTMVPPWTWGYRHVGRFIKIGAAALPWPTHHRPEEYEAALAAEGMAT